MWAAMAPTASCLLPEQMLAALCGIQVETARRWLRRAQAQLVFEERREFGCDEIRRLRNSQANSRIAGAAAATHLPHPDIAVPVGNRSVTREGLESHALEAVDGRYDHG